MSEVSDRRKLLALATMVYAIASLAVTWPLSRDLGSTVAGWRGDQATYLWGIDTFWGEILAGRLPFYTDRIFYPEGFSLLETTFVPTIALFAPPGVPGIAFLGLVTLGALVVAGLGMRRLLLELGLTPLPALVGGLLWLLAPVVLDAVIQAHPHRQVACALMPWGMLVFERLCIAVTWRRVLTIAAIVVALIGLSPYMTVVFVIQCGSLAWIRRPSIALAGTILTVAVMTAAILLAPPIEDLEDLNRGLQSWWSISGTRIEQFQEVGAIVGVLAVICLVSTALRTGVPYLLGGLVAGALAVGWQIRWGETVLFQGPWTPWGILMRLEPLTLLDSPNRMMVGVGFAAVVLASLGMQRVSRGWIVGLIGVAMSWQPIPMYTLPAPTIIEDLAADSADGTLMMLPGGLSESKGGLGYAAGVNNESMYWQTLHDKRRVGGHVARQRQSRYERALRDPVLRQLWLRYQPFREHPKVERLTVTREEWDTFVHRVDLRWIWLLPNQADLLRELQALAPDARVTEREGHTLLTLGDDPAQPDP